MVLAWFLVERRERHLEHDMRCGYGLIGDNVLLLLAWGKPGKYFV